MSETYDIAIIGAGPAGYVCAIRAAQLGLKAALIDKGERLGGCCLNIGCIPSKALLEASEWFHAIHHKYPSFGISARGVSLNLAAMMAKKQEIVNSLTDGIGMLMKKNGVTVVKGVGRLEGRGRILVEMTPPESPPAQQVGIPNSPPPGLQGGMKGGDSIEVAARNIVLAMGSVPIELPFMPFDHRYIVDSTDGLAFDNVPEHLVVVGAGAIGLELGSVWRRLGAKVTVVEMLPQIAPFADKQLATMLQRSLTAQGIEFHLEAKVTGAKVKKSRVTLEFEKGGKSESLTSDKVLVAVGRHSFSEGVRLETVGVSSEKNGRIPVDDHWQTNVPGIYAIGDMIAGPMLAHKASEEGIAVAEIIAGKPGHVNYHTIPNVIYTSPELAVVGLSEAEAAAKGMKVKVGKFYLKGNGRALSLGETDGVIKVVADTSTDRLLGVHILGPRASDMIAEAVIAMELGASAEDIARTVHAHPTLSEVLKEAALAVDKMQIHG